MGLPTCCDIPSHTVVSCGSQALQPCQSSQYAKEASRNKLCRGLRRVHVARMHSADLLLTVVCLQLHHHWQLQSQCHQQQLRSQDPTGRFRDQHDCHVCAAVPDTHLQGRLQRQTSSFCRPLELADNAIVVQCHGCLSMWKLCASLLQGLQVTGLTATATHETDRQP